MEDKCLPRIKNIANLLKGVIGEAKVSRYVDLGCGNGEFTLFLAHILYASEVYGIDIESSKVEFAKSRGIKAFKVDLNHDKIPFPDDYFDVITACEVIEHLINPDNMLREVYRTLKPGGLFALSTPNLASWLNRVLLLLGFQPTYSEVSTEVLVGNFKGGSKPSGHLRLFTYGALIKLLKYHGFTVLRSIGCSSTYSVPNALRFIDEALGKFKPSLGRILIVLCSKARD